MSPNISSFVGDLVAMAQAVEELPKALDRVKELEAHVDHANETIQARELSILSYKAEIEELNGKLHSAEVARDDAELRFLEADDRTQRALGFVKTLFGSAGGLIQALEPQVMPEPVVQAQPVDPKPEPDYHPPQVDDPSLPGSAGESNPTSAPVGTDTSSTASVSMSGSPPNIDSWASGPGQSEPLPSAPTGEPLPNASMTLATDTEHVGLTSTETSSAKPSGRYSGKRYYDWPTYVSFTDWMREGGKEEDYKWRPSGLAKASPSNY